MNIFDIPAFTDNYIWAIQIDDSITVIDPGDSKPVLNILEEILIDPDNFTAKKVSHKLEIPLGKPV